MSSLWKIKTVLWEWVVHWPLPSFLSAFSVLASSQAGRRDTHLQAISLGTWLHLVRQGSSGWLVLDFSLITRDGEKLRPPGGLVVTHFAHGKAKNETGSFGLENGLAAETPFTGEQAAYLTDDGGNWDCREVWVRPLLFFFSSEWEFGGNSFSGWHCPGPETGMNRGIKIGCGSVWIRVCTCIGVGGPKQMPPFRLSA